MIRSSFRPTRGGLLAAICLVLLADPLAAQFGGTVVIFGRVEDAASGGPVQGARILAADSSSAVYTDSLGAFAIQLRTGGTFTLTADQYGYLSQRFELDGNAPERVSVLLLEPAPIELEGIEVVEEAALTVLAENLEERRNSYPGPVRALDRERMIELVSGGTALDLVQRQVPTARPCSADSWELCVRGRAVSFRNPFPEAQILVCVDERRSFGAISELGSLPIESVSLVEVYGSAFFGFQVRLYTVMWMVSTAGSNRAEATTPWSWGC